MAQKWEDTKKQSAAMQKMQSSIAKQFGFDAKNPRSVAAAKATAKATPKPKKSPSAEKLLQDAINSGKIKNTNQLIKAKESIAARTGVWPNGKTN